MPDYLANTCTLQKPYLFYNPVVTGTSPANYQCTTLTSSTCTGSNLLFYDSTQTLHSCVLEATIVSTCAGYTSVFAYKGYDSTISATVYSCETASAITYNCGLASKVVYKTSTGTYQC